MQNNNMSGQEWPNDLDALIAAPEHHTLLLENDWVRVLEVRIPPGHITNIHTHRWPATVHNLSWSHFVRYDPHGKVLLDSKTFPPAAQTSQTTWSPPIPPHTLHNTGNQEIHNICVEIKNTNLQS